MDNRACREDAVRCLCQTFLFRCAPPELIAQVLEDERCVESHFSRGQTIFTPSSFTCSLGVLLSGSVQVSKEALIISVLRPGDIFGAAALFNDVESYTTTLTAQRSCELLLMPQVLVEEIMAQCPAVGLAYIRYLSGRIHFLNGKIDGLIAGSAERKLAQYLLEHGGGCVKLDCSITGLAKRLNVSRASLYRAFDALTEAGIAEKDGKMVQILDEKRLKSV